MGGPASGEASAPRLLHANGVFDVTGGLTPPRSPGRCARNYGWSPALTGTLRSSMGAPQQSQSFFS